LAGLKEPRLFALKMSAKAVCSCGAAASVQFAIACSKAEANELKEKAIAARAMGEKVSDVACGVCVSNRIVKERLIVSDRLAGSSIKLDRVPFDTVCVDCGAKIPFGQYAHFHADSGQAICTACGAKRAWTEKDRAVHSVKMLEIKEDIKALHKRYVIEAQGLHLLEEKVDLHQVAQLYVELESKVTAAVFRLNSYLLQGLASPEETKILQELARLVPELLSMAAEIKRELDARLFLMDKAERTQKMLQKVFAEADSEAEEAQRMAEMAQSEVSQSG
jgi:DNA-directed RNA polymerase subunit RPC12/RpoP